VPHRPTGRSLARGYSRAHRLTGEIVALLKTDSPSLLPGWRECYGDSAASAACITISIDKPATPHLT